MSMDNPGYPWLLRAVPIQRVAQRTCGGGSGRQLCYSAALVTIRRFSLAPNAGTVVVRAFLRRQRKRATAVGVLRSTVPAQRAPAPFHGIVDEREIGSSLGGAGRGTIDGRNGVSGAYFPALSWRSIVVG
jgi:hypothetical protein